MTPMIPSSSAVPQDKLPDPIPSVSNRAPDPSSAPPTADPVIEKKLSVARGDGYRREEPKTEHESGDHITLLGPDKAPVPCKYCGVNPCHGINWFFEGQSRFKCDACGRKQRLGVTAEVANATAARLEGMDRAETNRNRLWREDDARREEERQRQMDALASDPDSPYYGAMKNRQFVDSTFFS